MGVFEAAQMVALSIFGIEESVIFAYAVISHSFYLVTDHYHWRHRTGA